MRGLRGGRTDDPRRHAASGVFRREGRRGPFLAAISNPAGRRRGAGAVRRPRRRARSQDVPSPRTYRAHFAERGADRSHRHERRASVRRTAPAPRRPNSSQGRATTPTTAGTSAFGADRLAVLLSFAAPLASVVAEALPGSLEKGPPEAELPDEPLEPAALHVEDHRASHAERPSRDDREEPTEEAREEEEPAERQEGRADQGAASGETARGTIGCRDLVPLRLIPGWGRRRSRRPRRSSSSRRGTRPGGSSRGRRRGS